MTLWILIGFVIMLFLNPSFFIGDIIMFILIELILLSERFTQSVSANHISITIIYYHFLSKKEIVINRSETKSKLSKVGSFRSPVYFVLDIRRYNKRVYRIDSRDGFSKDELNMLHDNLNLPK